MTTVHYAFSIGTPSQHSDSPGALDYDVTLTIGDVEIEGEVTLYPDEANGGMGPCGSPLDGWVSSALLAALNKLPQSAREDVIAGLADPTDGEIEINVLAVGDRVEAGEVGTEDYDTGVVLEIDGDWVTVGWDSCQRSVHAASGLRPAQAD